MLSSPRTGRHAPRAWGYKDEEGEDSILLPPRCSPEGHLPPCSAPPGTPIPMVTPWAPRTSHPAPCLSVPRQCGKWGPFRRGQTIPPHPEQGSGARLPPRVPGQGCAERGGTAGPFPARDEGGRGARRGRVPSQSPETCQREGFESRWLSYFLPL